MKSIILITIIVQALGICAFSQPRNIIVERNREYTIYANQGLKLEIIRGETEDGRPETDGVRSV